MTSYTLNLADGGQCTEFFARDDAHAQLIAENMLDNYGLVFAEQWDSDGYNDDDEPCKRLLIWVDEASAENDSGANAIAQIETVGARA